MRGRSALDGADEFVGLYAGGVEDGRMSAAAFGAVVAECETRSGTSSMPASRVRVVVIARYARRSR